MRIAAGIILIIAAIMNIFAGAGYVLGGGLTAGAAMVAEGAGKQLAANDTSGAADAEAVAAAAKTASDISGVKGTGTMLMVFGLFLWVMFVLQIVGAVFLFISKSKMFIFIVAALSIIAEIIGVVVVAFGWTNIFGLLGGVLAFIGAMGIGKDAAPAAPAAA